MNSYSGGSLRNNRLDLVGRAGMIGIIAAGVVLACCGLATASTWSAGSADWTSDSSPGWNGTGVPNGVGAVATNPITATGTVIQNVPGLTVGTLELGGSGNFSWTHTLSNPIIFNEDGAAAGSARILNSNTSNGTTNALILGAGTLTLNDDLLISNIGNSTNATGAIQIGSTIGGNANVTLNNVSTALTAASSVRLSVANTFTGNVLVRNGTTTYATATSLGNAANAITLGENSQGAAALLSALNITLANPITVASGATGQLTLGTTVTNAFTAFSGPITLDGNVAFTSSHATNAMTVSSVISGNGGIKKVGPGIVALSGVNTYSGDTEVSAGSLTIAANTVPDGPGKGNVNLSASGAILQLSANEGINGLNGVAGTTVRPSTAANRNLTVGNNHGNSTFSGILANNGTGLQSLAKVGLGTFTLNGATASTSTGTLRSNFNGSTLRLDFANMPTATNLLNAGMVLQMSSGTFEILGKSTGATSQTFSTLSMGVNVGHDNTLLLSPNGGAGTTLTITSPTLSRIPGNSVNFAVNGGSGGTFNWGVTNLNGSILGGFALYNGNTWAVGNGTNIVGLDNSAYVTTTTNGNTAANYLSTHDIDITSSPMLTGGVTVNSVRFNTPGARTLTFQGTNLISSGGLLVTSAVGNNPTVITGGTLAGNATGSAGVVNGTVTSAADLVVHQFNTANILDISSVIADGPSGITAFTKNGPGTLKLSANNTHTGATFLANGKTIINSPNAIPHGSGFGNVSVNGILDLNGNNITVNNFDVRPAGTLTTGVAGNVTLTMGESNDTAAFIFNTGATVEDGAGVLSINKIGSGSFTAQAQATYSGGTTLTSGILSLASISTPTSGTVTSGPVGTGVLTLAGGTLNASTSLAGATIANAVKTNGATTIDSTSGALQVTLTGPLTSTNLSDSISFGTSSGVVLINGDISGYHGTFKQHSQQNSLAFLNNNVNGSNAKFELSGPNSGGSRFIRFGADTGTSASIKMGELSGSGGIAPTAGELTTLNMEVGHLDSSTEFSGNIYGRTGQAVNFTKVGMGALTLSGPNSYASGVTTVSAGTLIAGDNAVSTNVTGSTFVTSNASSILTLASHGFSVGDKATFLNATNLTNFTAYYVVDVPSANEFRVSATDMGTPISFTGVQGATSAVIGVGAFGASSSAIVLGDANTGSDSVSLLTGGAFTIERAVNVTANGSGVATIGSEFDVNSTFSGPITLSKNVNLTSAATAGVNTVNISGAISGGGFGVKKVGAGHVTLSGANTYSGDTEVQQGTLSVSLLNSLHDSGDVYITTASAILDLAFSGTDVISSLYFDGIVQATGTWGSIGSAATNQRSWFTGPGILSVTSAGGVPGDYNGNGTVDSADYVLWRKGGPLQNEVDNPGTVNAGDYTAWRARFGNISGAGAGSSLGDSGAVPEPGALVLAAVAGLGLMMSRRGERTRQA